MPVPEAMALRAVNAGLGVTPITASDITVTGYEVTTSVLSRRPYVSVANIEVELDLSGTAY